MIQRKKRVRHFQSPTHISDRVRKKIKKQESLTRERERERNRVFVQREYSSSIIFKNLSFQYA